MTDEQPNLASVDRNPAMDETLAPDNTDTASDAQFSTDAIPESLGCYAIKQLLGHGGTGAVYLAHDSQLDRDIAREAQRTTSLASGFESPGRKSWGSGVLGS